MKIGTVTGCVWATRKAEGLTGQTLLVVDCESECLVAADLVGAGQGDRVLVITGSTARAYCGGSPMDAAVTAILDR